MLGKLFKHEMKATSRLFLPLIIGYMAVTLLCKISFETVYSRSVDNFILNSITVIFFFLYFAYTVALFVMTFVFVAMHFYKTMVGEQGYLTNTLPVKTSGIINAKLLAAMLWQVLAGILLILSFSVFAMGHLKFAYLREFWDIFRELYAQASVYTNLPLLLFKFIGYSITSLLSATLMLYTSIALGHLFEKHRVIWAIAAYFVLHIAMQVITSALPNLFYSVTDNQYHMNAPEAFHVLADTLQQYSTLSIVFNIVCAAVLYVITNYVFSKRLNLD